MLLNCWLDYLCAHLVHAGELIFIQRRANQKIIFEGRLQTRLPLRPRAWRNSPAHPAAGRINATAHGNESAK